jgi:hypothetical protein
VVDDRGQPIAGALVEPVGGKSAEGRWWGVVEGVDPTVSDPEGRCQLFLPAGLQGVDLQVFAPGHAGTKAPLVKPGTDRHRIVVPAGTRVTGRLVQAGKPIKGLRVAVVQLERNAEHHFIKAVGAVSDADGKFAFDYLPANEDYAIFTLLGEGPQKLVLTTKRFKAHGDRAERHLGDLEVIPAQRLAGRVLVPEGQTLPANVKITLGRDPAWDLIAAPVGKDGSFAIDGLPPEAYEIRIAAKGFEIDGGRLPYQVLSEQSFGLRLRQSIEDLRIPVIKAGPAK